MPEGRGGTGSAALDGPVLKNPRPRWRWRVVAAGSRRKALTLHYRSPAGDQYLRRWCPGQGPGVGIRLRTPRPLLKARRRNKSTPAFLKGTKMKACSTVPA